MHLILSHWDRALLRRWKIKGTIHYTWTMCVTSLLSLLLVFIFLKPHPVSFTKELENENSMLLR